MFTGTLRFNLDPEDHVSDSKIEDVLRRANLNELIERDSKGIY